MLTFFVSSCDIFSQLIIEKINGTRNDKHEQILKIKFYVNQCKTNRRSSIGRTCSS
jgi:hypothetical protein